MRGECTNSELAKIKAWLLSGDLNSLRAMLKAVANIYYKRGVSHGLSSNDRDK